MSQTVAHQWAIVGYDKETLAQLRQEQGPITPLLKRAFVIRMPLKYANDLMVRRASALPVFRHDTSSCGPRCCCSLVPENRNETLFSGHSRQLN